MIFPLTIRIFEAPVKDKNRKRQQKAAALPGEHRAAMGGNGTKEADQDQKSEYQRKRDAKPTGRVTVNLKYHRKAFIRHNRQLSRILANHICLWFIIRLPAPTDAKEVSESSKRPKIKDILFLINRHIV